MRIIHIITRRYIFTVDDINEPTQLLYKHLYTCFNIIYIQVSTRSIKYGGRLRRHSDVVAHIQCKPYVHYPKIYLDQLYHDEYS